MKRNIFPACMAIALLVIFTPGFSLAAELTNLSPISEGSQSSVSTSGGATTAGQGGQEQDTSSNNGSTGCPPQTFVPAPPSVQPEPWAKKAALDYYTARADHDLARMNRALNVFKRGQDAQSRQIGQLQHEYNNQRGQLQAHARYIHHYEQAISHLQKRVSAVEDNESADWTTLKDVADRLNCKIDPKTGHLIDLPSTPTSNNDSGQGESWFQNHRSIVVGAVAVILIIALVIWIWTRPTRRRT